MLRFIGGIRNYHKVGINGYIIRNRINEREGMIRVVHNTGNALESLYGGNGDFLFAPHNHRQDITLYRISGFSLNVTLKFDDRCSGHGGYQHAFNSELIDGEMKTHWRACGDLDIANVKPIPEDGIFLESQEIHTLITEPSASWLIVEGELATIKHPRHVNHCYSQVPGFSLKSNSDLYLPMDDDCLRHQEFIFGEKINQILSLAAASL